MTGPATGVDPSEIEALQTALAGEHAALWVYGVLGGQTSRSATPPLFREVTAGYQAHRGRRDQLVRTIRDLGTDPVAAEVAYALPNPVATPRQVEQAALVTEQRSAATYADTVARTTGRRRELAIEALTSGTRPSSGPGGALPPGQQRTGGTRFSGPDPAVQNHPLHRPAMPSARHCEFSRCINMQM